MTTRGNLVLIGGGHTHVHVLKSFGMQPMPGVRLTLVARDVQAPYSGMLPGYIAGHYTHAQCHIDLAPLARFAGAELIHGEAVGLDRAAKHVVCKAGAAVPYDIVSIDIGSTPKLGLVPGAAEHATPVKPIAGLADRWTRIMERVRGEERALRVVTIGGGAAGVELTLAMQHRLRRLQHDLGRDPDALTFTIVTAGEILSGHNASARVRFRHVLDRRGIEVIENDPASRVEAGTVTCASGRQVAFDELVWVTEAGAASWLADTGLPLDKGGFIEIDATLRSPGDPSVFAVGDVASSIVHPRPKAGVFAVRQGPPLDRNLRRALAGQPPLPFAPQHKFLSLISTGDKYVIGSRGEWAAQGALLWHWKDWIDRRWMRQYQNLPERSAP